MDFTVTKINIKGVIDYRASRGGMGGAISSSSGSTSLRDLGSFPIIIITK